MIGCPVVHCHDGGGRSGVFVMLDANIRHIQTTGQLNIFSYLREIRSQVILASDWLTHINTDP